MKFEPHEIEWTTEKSKRLWDFYGSHPRYRATFFGYQAGRYVAPMLIKEVAAGPSARFLEFSCGQGDVMAALLPHLREAQEVHATDFSRTYVEAVSERFKHDARLQFARGEGLSAGGEEIIGVANRLDEAADDLHMLLRHHVADVIGGGEAHFIAIGDGVGGRHAPALEGAVDRHDDAAALAEEADGAGREIGDAIIGNGAETKG